jgi:hypothetical protein
MLIRSVPSIQGYNEANAKISEWMSIQAASRKELVRSGGNSSASGLQDDAFTLLVKANESENPKYKLTDQELVRHLSLVYS